MSEEKKVDLSTQKPKRPRGKVADGDARTETIHMRVTTAEKAAVKDLADSLGLTVTELVLKRLRITAKG